jgi:hypothetical protein
MQGKVLLTRLRPRPPLTSDHEGVSRGNDDEAAKKDEREPARQRVSAERCLRMNRQPSQPATATIATTVMMSAYLKA